MPYNVLFLCPLNSARCDPSRPRPMPTRTRRAQRRRFAPSRAGSRPKGGSVHPQALGTLERLGHDTGFARSKSWDEFAVADAPHMDFVFTVCDQAAAEECPVWPGHPATAHWGIPDPAAAEGTEAERALAFADAYRMLGQPDFAAARPADRGSLGPAWQLGRGLREMRRGGSAASGSRGRRRSGRRCRAGSIGERDSSAAPSCWSSWSRRRPCRTPASCADALETDRRRRRRCSATTISRPAYDPDRRDSRRAGLSSRRKLGRGFRRAAIAPCTPCRSRGGQV